MVKQKLTKQNAHYIYSKNVSYIQQKYKPYSAREYNPRWRRKSGYGEVKSIKRQWKRTKMAKKKWLITEKLP